VAFYKHWAPTALLFNVARASLRVIHGRDARATSAN